MKRRYLVSFLSVIAFLTSTLCSSAYAVMFTPPSGNGAPKQGTSGASRGNLFTPDKSNSIPRQDTVGASRGNLFTPDKGNGAPSQASGGASRIGTNPSTVAARGPAALVALLPQSFYGTTVSSRPTVMVYIPASSAEKAVFSIKDEVGNVHYQMTVPVAGLTGSLAIKLPPEAPALAIDKNYQWFLALKVDGELSPSTPYVDGWIKRIQPSRELMIAMQQQDALKIAAAFGEHGVWYDCIATLAGLYAQQSNNPNVVKQWQELLSSVDLKEIATAPLVSLN
ncbi:hypothetical protein NIES4071_00800 [Calothrix sp. NIES-4071]|nr:hypothetical protein NIES4071_00800 [Calothrix sp. NIES-4071]BAZ54426.1 hypothetical protein NIES4105_00790 [Calothrix sp. NIES-4105]